MTEIGERLSHGILHRREYEALLGSLAAAETLALLPAPRPFGCLSAGRSVARFAPTLSPALVAHLCAVDSSLAETWVSHPAAGPEEVEVMLEGYLREMRRGAERAAGIHLVLCIALRRRGLLLCPELARALGREVESGEPRFLERARRARVLLERLQTVQESGARRAPEVFQQMKEEIRHDSGTNSRDEAGRRYVGHPRCQVEEMLGYLEDWDNPGLAYEIAGTSLRGMNRFVEDPRIRRRLLPHANAVPEVALTLLCFPSPADFVEAFGRLRAHPEWLLDRLDSSRGLDPRYLALLPEAWLGEMLLSPQKGMRRQAVRAMGYREGTSSFSRASRP